MGLFEIPRIPLPSAYSRSFSKSLNGGRVVGHECMSLKNFDDSLHMSVSGGSHNIFALEYFSLNGGGGGICSTLLSPTMVDSYAARRSRFVAHLDEDDVVSHHRAV